VAGVNKVDTSGLTVDWWASSNKRHVIDYPVRSDAEIAAAVRDAFRYDPRLRDMQPAVAVNLGTVTLTGHVESARARAAAEEDARNTIGAWQVRNEVTAPPAGKANGAAPDLAAQWAADNAAGEWPTGLDRSPDGLTARIHDFFFWDPMVDSDRIEVSVSPDGVATLKGTVDTWSQIRAATNEARAAGARRVVNLLALRNHPEVASPDR
jgi:osmotically-inducible protein OsmY